MRSNKVTWMSGCRGAGKASRRLAAMKLCVLSMCFVVVFALTMAIACGSIGDARVSYADDEEGQTVGQLLPMFGNRGDISADVNFEGSGSSSNYPNGYTFFPGASNFTNWEISDEFSEVDTTYQVSKVNTSTPANLTLGEKKAGEFIAGYDSADDPGNAIMTIHYQVPTLFRKLIETDGFSLTVDYSFFLSEYHLGGGGGGDPAFVSWACEAVDEVATGTTSTINGATWSDGKFTQNDAYRDYGTVSKTGISLNKNYLRFTFTMHPRDNSFSNQRTCKIKVTNLELTFHISYKRSGQVNDNLVFNDGGAPVFANDFGYVSGQRDFSNPKRSGTSGAPSEEDNWPVYDPEQLGGTNNRYYPSDTDVKLTSYQGKPINVEGIDGISNQYYKYTQLTVIDSFCYLTGQSFNTGSFFSGTIQTRRQTMGLFGIHPYGDNITDFNLGNIKWVADGYTAQKYAAGLKIMEMSYTDSVTGEYGEKTQKMYESISAVNIDLTLNSGKTVGLIRVSRLPGLDYGAAKIEIFAYTNFELELVIKDFGDLELRRNITYGGIDTSAPDNERLTFTDLDEEGYFAKGGFGDKWLHDADVSIEFSTSEEPIAPNFYYIAVKKTNDVEAPEKDLSWADFAHKSDENWKVILLLTADITDSTFAYNFEKGEFIIKGTTVEAYADSGGETSGAGKYLFRIYAFDMAGNAASETVDYYINVDYDKPDFKAELTYGDGENAGTLTAADKGKWITEDNVALTLTPMLDGDNFFNISGNTLAFENEMSTIFVSAATQDAITSTSNGGAIQDGKAVIEVTDSMNKKIKLHISVADGVFTITFEDSEGKASPDMALNLEFTLLVGAYDDLGDVDVDSGKRGDWSGGIDVLVDKTAPTVSEFVPRFGGETVEAVKKLSVQESEAGVFGADLASLTKIAAGDRQWYGATTLGAQITLSDDMLNGTDEYADAYSIRIGVKGFQNNADLQTFIGKNFLSHFNTDFDPSKALTDWFDRYLSLDGTDVEYGNTVQIPDLGTGSIDLRYNGSSATAGLRLIFLWVVDQAGNCSAPVVSYVFSDSATYSLSAGVHSSELLDKNTAAFSIENGTGIKRGDLVTLSLSVAEGYVPYKLAFGGEGDVMLANYGATAGGFEAVGDYAKLLSGYDEEQDGHIRVQFTFDTADFDDITVAERALSFSHRLVVRATLGESNRVAYKAASGESATAVLPSDLTLVIQNLAEAMADKAKAAFRLQYVDAEGAPLYEKQGSPRQSTTSKEDAEQLEGGAPKPFAAIDAGTYSAYVYIPTDDEAFVASDVEFDESGEQILKNRVEIVIDPLALYVVAEEGSAVYGEQINLKYTLSPAKDGEAYTLNEAEGTLTGALALDGIGAEVRPNAGRHLIVQSTQFAIDGDHKDNFSLAFVDDRLFTVLQREVNIVILAAGKTFGDPDPILQFGVDKAQFKNGDVEATLAEIFDGYEKAANVPDGYDNFALYLSYGLARKPGEQVGAYEFDDDLSRLVVNSNYALVLDAENTQKFEITKRSVTIAVTGSTLLPYSSQAAVARNILEALDFDESKAKFGYRLLNSADMTPIVTDEIDGLLGELFKFEGDPVQVEKRENYEQIEYYTVKLADYESANVQLTLSQNADDNKYYVYVAEASVVAIEVRDGVSVDLVFGAKWQGATAYPYADHKGDFEVTIDGASAAFDDIIWSLAIEGHSDGDCLPVGSYVASIAVSGSIGGDQQDYKYAVGNIIVNVSPAEIVIKPTIAKNSRAYGQSDDEYAIDFEISTINGQALAEEGYAGITKAELEQLVRSNYGKAYAFVRAVFADGERFASADIRDGATDPDTHLNADGRYYAVEFAGTPRLDGDKGANFTLSAQADNETRLDVTPKPLEIDIAKFVGISKDYDGTALAFYSGNALLGELSELSTKLAYDLRRQLLFGDEVLLGFEATYSNIGSPATPVTECSITFAKFTLESANGKAGNYVIGKLLNSAENGAKAFGEVVSKGYTHDIVAEELATLTIEIFLTDNTSEDNTNKICVRAGAIGVWYGDITLGKVYDGRTNLSAATLDISDRLASDGTSKASPYLLKQAKWSLPSEVDGEKVNLLADADSGDRKYVTLALFFTFDNLDVSQITIANQNPDDYPEYSGADVTVKVETIDGEQGILVLIPNFAVNVAKRVIDGDSFRTLTYKSRPYNGLDTVEVDEMTFADGAIVESDAQTLGLTLIGSITGGDKGGKVDVGEYAVRFVDDPAYSGIANGNYLLDVESVNNAYAGDNAIKVNITPAQLVPYLVFASREYDAQTLVAKDGYEFGGTHFKTLQFYEQLADELSHLTLIGTFEVNLSKAGKKDANVYVDADGGYLHSVLLSEFSIKAESGINLANYELVGLKDEDGNAQELSDGLEVTDLEIEGAIELVKAKISVIENDVKVRDKIYDDSYAATIDLPVPQTVPESDRDYLSIRADGTFTRKTVGSNIPVKFADGGATLVVSDPTKQYLIDNYEIELPDATFGGNILARPVGVQVELGVKTYDGSASINTDNLTYTFDSSTMISRDVGKYNVQTTGGAYFDDANVALAADGDVAEKRGHVYDPVLKYKNSTAAELGNYVLVAVESEAREGVSPYAVLLFDGTILLGAEYESAPSEQFEVSAYFYDLPSATRGIDASEADAVSKAGEHFIGYIEKGGKGYVLVDDGYEGAVTTFETPVSYIAAEGRIERRTLSITNGAVQATKNTKAFAKQYDGTVKFFGKADADFTFDRTKLAGVREGDEVYLTNIVGEFDKADSTATVVIFKGTLAGAAKDNYVLSDNATATVRAKILKRTITASLADGTMTYGTLPGSIVGDITYNMGGFPITVVDRAFYIKLFDFLSVTGFMADSDFANIAPEDKAYIDVMTAGSLFALSAGEFLPFDGEPTQDTYLKLSGEFIGLPCALATFDHAPNAGVKASEYVLTGGDATNFTFAYAYTGNGTSTLTVIPKDVYITATNISNTVPYGSGKIPTGGVAFYDETGAPYTLNTNLFFIGNINYGPRFGWYLYDTGLPGSQSLTAYPSVLDPLSGGRERMYVGNFYIPEGVNYAEGTAPGGRRFDSEIKNYNFHFGTVTHQSVEGQNVYYIQYGQGSPYNATTATLVVTRPEITGLTAAEYTEFVYDGNGSSNSPGTNKLLSMIAGLTSNDAVRFVGRRTATWLSSGGEAVNGASVYLPGTYNGTLTVTRTYKWDEGDSNGYSVSQTFDGISFEITPKVPALYTNDDSVRFDGNVYKYGSDNITGDLRLRDGDFVLAYEKLVGSVYYPAYAMGADGQQIPLLKDAEGYYALDSIGDKVYYGQDYVRSYAYTDQNGNVVGLFDVGAYRVSITPTDRCIASAQYCYQKVTVYAYVTITARPVEVRGLKVDGQSAIGTDAQGAAVFSMMFDENKQYGSLAEYDVQTLFDEATEKKLNEDAVIAKANTKLIGLENVAGPGRYSFSVVIENSVFDASNYSFVAAKGVLELKSNYFVSESGKGLTADDSLKFTQDSSDGVVANRLTVRQINGAGGSGADLDLWKRLETYMPAISDDARLAAVLQVRLYLGSTRVYATGEKMELSVKIPEGVDSNLKDVVVYVSKNGGLVKLTDYTIADGKLIFATDNLGEIVFVDISVSQMPAWAITVIIVASAIVAAFAVWVVVAFIIRRSKLKKLV